MKLGRAVTGLGAALFLTLVAVEGCGGGQPNGFGDLEGGAPTTTLGSDGSASNPYGDDDASFVSLQQDGSASLADDGGHYADATPDVGATDGACVAGDAGPAPYPEKCAPSTSNECSSGTDSFLTASGVGASLLNGSNGNGFDDDCDGQVDEGCTCPQAGVTKDCYLVPPTQVNPATGAPVGWCTTNSKGSLDCAGSEFPVWSGTCRGAQPPYAHDVCSPGDFNCDGLPENSDQQDCSCHPAVVTCPTAAVTEAPYPDPKNITAVDGSQWVGSGQIAQTTNWKWTVIGGDCDNILPHPTFALYAGKDTTATGARIGTRTPVAYETTTSPNEYVSTAGAPLVSIQASTANGAAGATVYPAFGLSGDYIVQGEFDLSGTHYVCTQQVQVRAPGIRAELCWDTVGSDSGGEATGAEGKAGANDIDLHFARLQGITCSKHGWGDECEASNLYQDCWYADESGCRDFSESAPGWGYADSAQTACIGWGSERSAPGGGTYIQGCTNPRLDRDNVTCDPTIDDPTNTGGGDDNLTGVDGFCGPENINLDNPANGDQFVVGVNHYDNHQGYAHAHPHVNIYCNGARVVSAGYNPLTTGSSSTGPILVTPGEDTTGDIWEVATVKWDTANAQGCDVATVGSTTPDATRDGANNKAVCVDSHATGAPKPYKNQEFIEATGANPTTAAGFCKH